jgi:hypothetical protein
MKDCNRLAVTGGNLNTLNLSPNVFAIRPTPARKAVPENIINKHLTRHPKCEHTIENRHDSFNSARYIPSGLHIL